ncbi:hypothetical protein BC830DRAFT_960653 [Chytriomyces sp. MP71]|nr:hypothetical protein BC830DRAFT_960653 [Chytriomyces sp. MP71]
MERLSAMLQRKEQELLLQREREASGNSGASTLELKLLIQEKYSKLKELERRELASVSESPQQTRSNVLGLLARRVNQAANPVPVAAPGTPPATPETGSDANAAKEGLDRRPSLDDFIETGHFNSSLASTDLSLPATQSETPAYSAEAVSHFRIKSGLDEPSVALRFTPDRHVAPLVTDSTDAALDPGSDGSALPSLSVGVTPAPPILPRTSSKKIGSMLQQLDSMTPAFPGSTSDPASNPVLESPPKLNVPLPTQTRFTTLRKEDWGAFKNLKKQQLSQQLMQQANNGAKPESAMRVTSNESNTSEMSDSDTELDVSPKRTCMDCRHNLQPQRMLLVPL